MKKLRPLVLACVLFSPSMVYPQSPDQNDAAGGFALSVHPYVSIPLGENDDFIKLGGGGQLSVDYRS